MPHPKKAVYPGSFDPMTMGHIDIIERISKIFDEVIVLISDNSDKHSLFTVKERKHLAELSLTHCKNVKVDVFQGLTTDYVKKNKAQTIIRGLRAVVDFEYEMTMANMNKKLAKEVETMLVFATPEFYYIASRGVKEVAKHGGSLEGLVPDCVKNALLKKIGKHK